MSIVKMTEDFSKTVEAAIPQAQEIARAVRSLQRNARSSEYSTIIVIMALHQITLDYHNNLRANIDVRSSKNGL